MGDALSHRGPDGAGTWVDPKVAVALGHRRLAIIDLSREGHQPMLSATGRYVVTYNGEIYNFRSIGRELADLGWRFRGHSDTEVLLAAVEQWGFEAALAKLAGMFAFALWDREARVLHLARDRMGKKPLYFGRIGRDVWFASELKALHRHPAFAAEVDRGALSLLLRHGCVPSPHTIYRGVFKLPPGSVLTLSPADARAAGLADLQARVRPYWSLAEVARQGIAEPFALGPEAAVDALDELLSRVTAERMISDVPLGALLSGGIDSSSVVALMQQQSARPVKTFSIGFHESSHDEATAAKRVAGHLGTAHTELYVTPDQAQAVIPQLPAIYDEPFADRSQIPTFLVAQLARQQVTVALSGDGGDEVFGGYNRHFFGPWLWHRMKAWPRPVRRQAARALTAVSPQGWDAAAHQIYRFLPPSSRQPLVGFQIHKIADLLNADAPQGFYRRLTSYWQEPDGLVIDGREPSTVLTTPGALPGGMDFAHSMMYCDAVTYLPDDILVKVDRASMAVSLEVRAPLLDHRVVEFAWRLPGALKVRGRQGKWILRRVLDRYVPRHLVDRPKQGFDLPIDAWLRGPLRDWAEAMLAPGRLAREGFLRPEPIRTAWVEHLDGTRNHGWRIWPVLMFQTWQERWLGPASRDSSSRPPAVRWSSGAARANASA
jgi:asparagine synthase (glutamine-hydrolysing)